MLFEGNSPVKFNEGATKLSKITAQYDTAKAKLISSLSHHVMQLAHEVLGTSHKCAAPSSATTASAETMAAEIATWKEAIAGLSVPPAEPTGATATSSAATSAAEIGACGLHSNTPPLEEPGSPHTDATAETDACEAFLKLPLSRSVSPSPSVASASSAGSYSSSLVNFFL